MFGTDLPPGEWSSTLIGGYWPGHDALDILAVAAAGRHRSEAQFHAYADQLRSISQAQLAGQDGVTADAARSLFARGEDRARATAERNAAKRHAYESARHRVAALRDDLSQLAADGNAAIRRIQESSVPLAAKVSGIVDVIAGTQTLARTKTAESAGNLLADVQHVLDVQGADASARAFATTHGIDPAPPRLPALESLTQQVTAQLESHGETEPSTASAGIAGPGGQGCDGNSGRPGQAPSAGELAGSVAGLTAGAGLLTAGLAAGGTIGASLTGAVDAPAGQGAQPAGPVPTGTAVGAAPAASPTSAAAAASASTGAGRSYARPIAPGLPAAPPPPRPAPAGGHPAAMVPGRPGAAAGPHPTHATTAAGGAGLIRRNTTAVPGTTVERALAGTSAPARNDRLTPVLTAMAQQEPRLRWAVGERADGGMVLATDLAGGWIPPDVQIPADVRLLDPGLRSGTPADLLSDCGTVVSYIPGQQLSPQPTAVSMSATPREVAAVRDLGWELTRATLWRDGLPRLAHTLARAATTGTGWLESEAALLRDHVGATADRVLAGYPENVLAKEVGNWQLLATIGALVSGDRVAAAYHFAWFTAGATEQGCPR
ncbi:MAG: hypothetical protein QG655_1250 [Actinomycetota bacterium]|jgi:hypothetical protein|nr:hypothetical protein [Actinomycetota bacterium]